MISLWLVAAGNTVVQVRGGRTAAHTTNQTIDRSLCIKICAFDLSIRRQLPSYIDDVCVMCV